MLIDGEPAGAVTSGNFSPVLGHGIGLAFLPPDVEEGTAVEVDVRGLASSPAESCPCRSSRRPDFGEPGRQRTELAPRLTNFRPPFHAYSSMGGQEHMRLRSP